MKLTEKNLKCLIAAMAFIVCGYTVPAVAQDDNMVETEKLSATDDDMNYENLFDIEGTEEHDVLSLLRMEENLSTFVELLDQSGLDASVAFAGPVTIFAPTNEAFQSLSKERYSMLTDPENRVMLSRILQAHILPNKVYMSEFQGNQMIETSDGEEIPVGTSGVGIAAGEPSSVVIGGAVIVKSDVEAKDAVIHVVDNVIIPSETWDSTVGN